VDATDRNDGATDDVFPSRNPELIFRYDAEVVGIEDAPNGDGVFDACEG
jgi:hypothetical protein